MPMRIPPGPPGLRFIGNIEAYEDDRLGFLTRCARDHGDIAAYSRDLYIISGPDLVERLLSGTNREFMIAQSLFRHDVGLGHTATVMRARRLMGRGLHRRAVLAQVPTIVALAAQLAGGWCDRAEINIQQEMELLTARITAAYCFGADGLGIPFLTKGLLDALVPVASSPFVFPAWCPTPAMVRARRAFRRLVQAIRVILERRHREGTTDIDLLSLMMAPDQQGEQATDESIVYALLPLLVASLRVPAASLSWIWYLLDQHPQSEARVLAEVDAALGQAPLDASTVDRLEFLQAVVKEALRLYPPTWVIERKVVVPCTLGGYPLRKGLRVTCSPYVLHRDPRYFEHPDRFLPERWMDSDWLAALPRTVYIPFGGGPRGCVGSAMATTEIVAVIATILPRVRLRLSSDSQVTPDVRNTLVPKNLRMRVELR